MQAIVLGLIRSLVSRNPDVAAEILHNDSRLLDALDPRLAPEAVAVVRAAVYNDYHQLNPAGVDPISGAWLAAQPADIQQSIRRTLLYAALYDGGGLVTKHKVLQTCLDFIDQGGDRHLFVSILGTLASDDNSAIQLLAVATLARLATDSADAILANLVEDDETLVTIGVAWGRDSLAIDPPSAETDSEEITKAMNVAAVPWEKPTEQIVLSELVCASGPGVDMDLSPGDDLDVVVAHVLKSRAVQCCRETIDLLQERADEFRTPLRRRLVETLKLGTINYSPVENVTAKTIAKLCVTTDDRRTWERGIEVLRPGTSERGYRSVVVTNLAEMAASVPSDVPVQPMREAFYEAIVNGGQKAAVAAVEGIAATGPDALEIYQAPVSIPECRPNLGKASRANDLSKQDVSVAIDLAANTEAITSISAPSTEK